MQPFRPPSKTAFPRNPAERGRSQSAIPDKRAAGQGEVFRGTPFGALGSPAVMVAWPGSGCSTAGFNFCFSNEPRDFAHTHQASDECLILWAGRVEAYLGERERLGMEALDCILAPCGVFHAPRLVDGPAFLGGFASPPQIDLALKTEFYKDGVFSPGPSTRLEYPLDDFTRTLFQA